MTDDELWQISVERRLADQAKGIALALGVLTDMIRVVGIDHEHEFNNFDDWLRKLETAVDELRTNSAMRVVTASEFEAMKNSPEIPDRTVVVVVDDPIDHGDPAQLPPALHPGPGRWG
jgi:hypothetical protein